MNEYNTDLNIDVIEEEKWVKYKNAEFIHMNGDDAKSLNKLRKDWHIYYKKQRKAIDAKISASEKISP